MSIVETTVSAHADAVSQQVEACVDAAVYVQVAGGIANQSDFARGFVSEDAAALFRELPAHPSQ